MNILHRHSLRLQGYDYSAAGGYYVTFVAFRRECLFGDVVSGGMRLNDLGRMVKECWNEIPLHFSNAGINAVMPNHVHGIIFVFEDKSFPHVGAQHAAPLQNHHPIPQNVKPGSLEAIVQSFKSAVTYRANRELNSANIWQRNYYEHIIRDQKDYERIAAYILANPSNWNQDEENPILAIK